MLAADLFGGTTSGMRAQDRHVSRGEPNRDCDPWASHSAGFFLWGVSKPRSGVLSSMNSTPARAIACRSGHPHSGLLDGKSGTRQLPPSTKRRERVNALPPPFIFQNNTNKLNKTQYTFLIGPCATHLGLFRNVTHCDRRFCQAHGTIPPYTACELPRRPGAR
jgi:hypothetical protein